MLFLQFFCKRNACTSGALVLNTIIPQLTAKRNDFSVTIQCLTENGHKTCVIARQSPQ